MRRYTLTQTAGQKQICRISYCHMVREHFGCVVLCLFVLLFVLPDSNAQLSFSDAVRLAVQNSPKIAASRNDQRKAQDNLAAMKDMYIPSVVVGAGVGYAYGPTLNLPTIFNINAQSLIYSPQQRSYIRSAHSNLQAAQLALDENRQEVEEDAIITYLSLDNAQNTLNALQEQFGYAMKLVSIIEDRVSAKLDSQLDLKNARRTALEIRLHQMLAEDDLESLHHDLTELTGVPADQQTILPKSIPDITVTTPSDGALGAPLPESPGILAAEANVRAREQQAHGDAQYIWRPQIAFGAQYGRISPIENVSKFYNINGDYNSTTFGIQIQFPLFDKVRKNSARQTAMDAAHAEFDLKGLRVAEEEGRRKLVRSLGELAIKSQLADLDYGIAQDQLQSVLIQMHASSGSPPLTPKDEQKAHLEERQKYVDLLAAKSDAIKAEVTYLRQSSQLDNWLQSVNISLSTP
jgi:muconolactone delta-isomerase